MRKVTVLLIFALAQCLGSFASSIAQSQVGVLLPLSGDMAECGRAVQNGIELSNRDARQYFADINFIYEDTRYDATTTVSAARKLLTTKRLDLLFVWGEYPSAAMVDISEKEKVPTLLFSVSPDIVKGKKYSLRFQNSAREYVSPLLETLHSAKVSVQPLSVEATILLEDQAIASRARFFESCDNVANENYWPAKSYPYGGGLNASFCNRERLPANKQKIALLYVDDPYYLRLIEGIQTELRPGQEIINSINVSLEEMDFRPLIARLKKLNADAVAVYLMPGQASTFFRQAKALHFNPQFFGGDIFESKSEIEASEGAMEGALYSHNTASPDFKKRYIEAFGNDLQLPYAANGYALAQYIAKVFHEIKPGTQANEIISALKDQKKIHSDATGDFELITLPESGSYFRFPVAVKQIRGLASVEVYR